jgi:hypothetical protein
MAPATVLSTGHLSQGFLLRHLLSQSVREVALQLLLRPAVRAELLPSPSTPHGIFARVLWCAMPEICNGSNVAVCGVRA